MGGLIERHDGRLINTWGDAVIIEFASAVEAVQCAVEIQNELAHRNHDLPDSSRLLFRIGINLGDVMVEGDDIYGDGVNIAARLQECAEPGGILLSQSVYDQVRQKLAVSFVAMGPQRMKHVSEPVPTYRVRLGGRNDAERDGGMGQAEREDGGREADGGDGREAHGRTRDANSWSAWIARASSGFRGWFRQQPIRVRRAVGIILFLFVVNLLSTGLDPMWFVWPSLPFAAFIGWHVLGGGSGRDS